jgi:hypothetical protein
MRRLHFALLSLVLVLAAQPLFATTYYVSTNPLPVPCTSEKGGFVIFPSIQYAVTHVPEGSAINICPGTYSEQVTISKALTLQGVSYNNSSQVIIAIPPGGLTTTSSLYFGTVAAQVEVTAEAVNITGITVDGTASSSNCPGVSTGNYSLPYVGILFSSGSSGTVNQVETRYQTCNLPSQYNLYGVGILAENGSRSSRSVTIENSNIHDYSLFGIFAYSNQTPSSLTASIKSNYVYYPVSATIDIGLAGAAGNVSDNTVTGTFGYSLYGIGSGPLPVTGPDVGIAVGDGVVGVVVDSNTVTNTGIGVGDAATVTSNHISNGYGAGGVSAGITLGGSGATIKDNIIQNNGYGTAIDTTGIAFNCNKGNTVSGNTINGATTGLSNVPAGFTGVNYFHNVGTVSAYLPPYTGGC